MSFTTFGLSPKILEGVGAIGYVEPTPIQERRMAEIRAAGGLAFWGTAEKVLKEFNEYFQT